MAKLEIGVLEIISDSVAPRSWQARLFDGKYNRLKTGITPQAVAAWCRQLGHEVHYATYYGQQDPKSLLPESLDVVFLSTFTKASPLAYALAKLYRREGSLTVIGGCHAKAFPLDCVRFFDFVVLECDKALVEDILGGAFDRRTVISSGRPLTEIPSVEERMPDILTSFRTHGHQTPVSAVALLSSVGCPYRCDFCVDWDNPYVMLPEEHLKADLHYISKHLPGTLLAYHDPNFGIKFDQVLDIVETVPPEARNPYVMESSLSVLRGQRLQRLKDTRCYYIAPGIESWADYSNKAGVGKRSGAEKLERLVDHFHQLYEYVAGIQGNIIFGTDLDVGEEPIELTTEFCHRVPFVWPSFQVPIPYGATPLFDRVLAEGRVLEAMPFSFYFMNLVIQIKNYGPIEYLEKMIRLYDLIASPSMAMQRAVKTRRIKLKAFSLLRASAMRRERTQLRRILGELRSDPEFLAFHEGKRKQLPAFYRHQVQQRLGPYAEVLSEAELRPVLDQLPKDLRVAPSATGERLVSTIGRHPVAGASAGSPSPVPY